MSGNTPSAPQCQLPGQVAVVTGAASGIGRNIAWALGQAGAHVVLCDKDRNSGLQTATEFKTRGISAEFLPIDLSKSGAPQNMVAKVFRRHGRVDILVNNARSGKRTNFLDETEKTWADTLSVTLTAAYFASQEAVRVMSKRKCGCIINISSVSAFLSCRESAAYHVAKAGMLQMTRYLAGWAGAYGVRVNAILPGFIIKDEDRPRYEKASNSGYREIAEFCHPGGAIGSADDVANAVQFLCSSQAHFITGQSIVVDGGLTIQEQSGLAYRLGALARK